ncbi:LacI family DNA-binding transcriptional regulator [Erwinia billingiae]|uniref:LacI family DNA-binding transcriptional regulator n=1 Tax=Erwinia billingiae TaxID=182337 RepID=UPI0012450100|nr:LacI family DNA-binding transcriptional regulator [Erwinia billingiae]QEW31566.1 LacI family DNA-binding transcriptional regulator [Erwinia billingiae]
MKPRSVTLDDVAAAAGVSYQTVSRVLNHSASVAEKTRLKVEAAMVALNYVPNRVAQQLAGKHSRTLGLATSDLALLAPAQMASAIQQRATALGYRLVIAMSGAKGPYVAVQELLAQRVDALLVNLPLDNASASHIAALTRPLPGLFLDVPDDAPVPACQYSAETGARQGIEHLLALGHREIALLNGPKASVAAASRHQTWLRVLAENQLTPHRELTGDWSAESGYQATLSLFGSALPTALLVANDQMALGALRALHQAGLQIPAEISVVGYDDTAESAWYQPPLTTVRQDIKQLGERSVDWLVQTLNEEQSPALMRPFATRLIIRETTAAPPQQRVNAQAMTGKRRQPAEKTKGDR